MSETGMTEKSVYGEIPDRRVSDMDVYVKYDFNTRKVDTSHLVINKPDVKAEVKNKIIDLYIFCHLYSSRIYTSYNIHFISDPK